ncbi:MAG TPA: hypothetical protein VGH97_15345 [Thermoanaerobaculia bacterium]
MRRIAVLMGFAVLWAVSVAAVLAQQPAPRPTPMIGMRPTAKPELLKIYQIDLIPSGSAFALSEPVLEGDSYVFIVWPEKETVHLKKEKVRKITQRTKDLEQYVIFQIDLKPTGKMYAKENPTLKNGSYTFHTWKENKLMALRQADVKGIQKLQGLPAFKAQQEEKGAALIGNLPMEGGGSVVVFSEPPPPLPAPAPDSATGQYPQGNVGSDWAYPPGNAVVERPGDVPKMPTPRN